MCRYLFKNMFFSTTLKIIVLLYLCIAFPAILWLRKKGNILYEMQNKRNEHLKYILLWTNRQIAPFPFFGTGQNFFIKKKCPVQNCYVTDNRRFFKDGLKNFDAILFNGRQLASWQNLNDAPKERYPHQKYVFVMTESAFRFPICTEIFDNFFNWTFTYRLDSDCVFKYFTITDKMGVIVGPKQDIEWISEKNMKDVDETFAEKLKTKSKPAAWFVSNCQTEGGRERYYVILQEILYKFNLTIDVYGPCRELKCPKSEAPKCDAMLGKNYFFYLAFESSFSEGYVTEKVLHALNHYTVPIVYGAADYSLFLPPGSYLRTENPTSVADTIHANMKNPDLYKKFFKWTSYYKYHKDVNFSHSICDFCQTLNDKANLDYPMVYDDFRWWWHRYYEKRCQNLHRSLHRDSDEL